MSSVQFREAAELKITNPIQDKEMKNVHQYHMVLSVHFLCVKSHILEKFHLNVDIKKGPDVSEPFSCSP